MNIALCDDESYVLDNISALILDHAARMDYDIHCDKYLSGNALLACGRRYELYFLDYIMDEIDGLALAEKLIAEQSNAQIIFLTSEGSIIRKAIAVARPYRFLLKPVNADELHEALDSFFKSSLLFSRIALKRDGYTDVLNVQNILYVEAQAKKCTVRTESDTVEYPYSISEIEALLPKELFVRPHRSYLVNMRHIERYDNDVITMKNGERVKISKYMRKDFLELYREFIDKYIM